MVTSEPTLRAGELLTRAQISDIFGGSRQAAIVAAARTDSVLLFSGERSGPDNGWLPGDEARAENGSRLFRFTGVGGTGDQSFDGIAGEQNAAVLLHAERGQVLRLFVAADTGIIGPRLYRYVGPFMLDNGRPYEVHAGPDSTGTYRRVIDFRLVQTGEVGFDRRDEAPVAGSTNRTLVSSDVAVVKLVEPERRRAPNDQASEVDRRRIRRREAELSDRLEEQLIAAGHEVKRVQITIKGKASFLVTDLYDVTAHVLYELKSTSSRESVRMALGQLLDYARFVTFDTRPARPHLSIGLPTSPDSDLLDLLVEHQVKLTHCANGVFTNTPF